MSQPFRIEIKSTAITEVSGVSKAGKPYHIRKQPAWAYMFDDQNKPNPYPERIELNLADGQEPFGIGNYIVGPSSFYVGDFHQLTVGRLVLEPVVAVQPQRAA